MKLTRFGAMLVAAMLASCTINVPSSTTTPPPVTSTTPPPVNTPPVQTADENTYPLTLSAPDASNMQTAGKGPTRVDFYIGAVQPQPYVRSFVVIIDGTPVIAPQFDITNNGGMGLAGDNHVAVNGPWDCSKIKVQFVGVAGGINGLFFNSVTCNYLPLVANGMYGSRGETYVNNPVVFLTAGNEVDFTQPVPVAASSTPAAPVSTQHGLADAIAAASGTLTTAAGTYNESVGINKPLTLEGGGVVVNPGLPNATYTPGAILDGAGVQQLVQSQGGMVPLSDGVIINGWEVRGYGLGVAHDGTAGIRNNAAGTFYLNNGYIHGNQMGIGPHGGDATIWHVHNSLFFNNGCMNDLGYCHNMYLEGIESDIDGGVTSIVAPGAGQGHTFKSRALATHMIGQNYFYGSDASGIDISDGTSSPFTISCDAANDQTVIEKKAGDANTVLLGYGPESTANGNAGGTFSCTTLKIPNDGRSYIILTSGLLTFANDNTNHFVYTDGTPIAPGRIVVQGAGSVVGLP